MSLQRMIIIPPDVFEKWRHIIIDDKRISELDRKMKNIIYNKNLNDIDKWYHYRENLLKYTFNRKNDKLNINELKRSSKPSAITSEKESQTNYLKKEKLETIDEETQTQFNDDEEGENNIKQQNNTLIKKKSLNQIFESMGEDDASFKIGQNLKNNNENTETKFNDDEENNMDDEEHDRMMALADQPKNIGIHRRLSSSAVFKTYELTNGDVVSVPRKNKDDWNKSPKFNLQDLRSPYRLRSINSTIAKSEQKNKEVNSKKAKTNKKKFSQQYTANGNGWISYK